jgi:hypothetical protein
MIPGGLSASRLSHASPVSPGTSWRWRGADRHDVKVYRSQPVRCHITPVPQVS